MGWTTPLQEEVSASLEGKDDGLFTSVDGPSDPAPEGVEPPPGLDSAPCEGPAAEEMPPSLPSVGSVGHAQGQCRPCAHSWKPTGCSKGRSCTFCHLCDKDDFASKRRQSMIKRRSRRSEYLKAQRAAGRVAAREAEAGDSAKADSSEESMRPTSSDGGKSLFEHGLQEEPRGSSGTAESGKPESRMCSVGPDQAPPPRVASAPKATSPLDGDSLGDRIMGRLLSAAWKKAPQPDGFEEQETATPSSEESHELRMPLAGFAPLTTDPPAWPTHAGSNADSLPEYESGGCTGLWSASPPLRPASFLPLGEPVRITLSQAVGYEFPVDAVRGAYQITYGRHAPAPIFRGNSGWEPRKVPTTIWGQGSPQQDGGRPAAALAQGRRGSLPGARGEAYGRVSELRCSPLEPLCRPPPGIEPPPEGAATGPRAGGFAVEVHSDNGEYPEVLLGSSRSSKGTSSDFCHLSAGESIQQKRMARMATRRKAAGVAPQLIDQERLVAALHSYLLGGHRD